MSVCILGAGDDLGSASQEHTGQARALQGPHWEPLFRVSSLLCTAPGGTSHLTTSLSIHLSMDMRLFPCLGCREWCCSEQWGVCIFLEYAFLWIYAQEWDFWIIRVKVFSTNSRKM